MPLNFDKIPGAKWHISCS